MAFLRSLLVYAILATTSQALIHQLTSELPTREYDFIVVGGGTAGNVIANRLTERGDVSVLVLEAGPSHVDAFPTKVPFYGPTLAPGPYDWGYTTAPQTSLNNREIGYPRGFVLGGSSSINYMAYTRCSAEDYDRYAKVTGDKGWSWDNLIPYIRKNEIWTESSDNHVTSGQFDPQHHSRTGKTAVALPNFPRGVDAVVQQAIDEFSSESPVKVDVEIQGSLVEDYNRSSAADDTEWTAQSSTEFPFNLDMNSGNELGFGWGQWTTKNGARDSSATSYLADKYVKRPNLSVLVNARVTKIVKTGTSVTGPIFRGVEFTQDAGANKVTLRAKKEVILSAGSVGTPAILLHSGIGNSSTLTGLGITPILDLPSVGQNLTEHPLGTISWLVNSTDTFERITRDPVAGGAAEAEWNATQTGFMSASVSSHIGFFRLPKSNALLKDIEDPASGPTTPHYELIPVNGFFGPPPPTGNYFTMIVAAVQPTARGSITIKSTDPLAAPSIDPNLLGTSLDLGIMREAILSARRFIKASPFKNYLISEVGKIGDTNESIEAYLRDTTTVVFHPTGTAMMTKKSDKYGVVNPDLKVKGAVGLRVVDASIFPFIPAGHTQAPVYIIAERAADVIKASYNY